VKTAADLVSNSFVDFSGKGDLTVSAGLKLAGGENKAATGEDYADFLKELELHEFNVLAMPVNDPAIKAVTKEFVRRLREEDGRKIQAVLPDYKEADYEGIISVKNGVYIKNNVHVSNIEATSYVAALTASAGYAASNTYAEYEGAINVDCRYSDREIITAIQDGEIVFIKNGEKILVEQDINTLKTFIDGKKSDFRKNRVIRVLDGINNRIKTRWEEVYIGKTSNNEDGRNLFKKDVLKILETLESEGALENVTIDDIDVEIGASKDSVLVKVNAQPVDAMEKIYMTVYV
jgi:sulfur carrier protein ThiS